MGENASWLYYTLLTKKRLSVQDLPAIENRIATLQETAVRDLAWACFSQCIYSHFRPRGSQSLQQDAPQLFPFTETRWRFLQQLDAEPISLHEHLKNSAQSRLGLYFEALIAFFLRQDPEFCLLAHNLPVRSSKGQQTYGAFDFIYEQSDGKIVHLETAIKFYMGVPEGQAGRRWLGPALHDSLEEKLNKLEQKQSRLAEHSASMELLYKSGIALPDICRIGVCGELYYRPAHAVSAPDSCFEAHHKGKWCPINELGAVINAHTGVRILDRQDWISPSGPDACYTRLSDELLAQLSARIRRQSRAQLIELQSESGDRYRCFVTAA